MRWRDAVLAVPMSRVALVAPGPALRDALVRVADTGTVEIDRVTAPADLPPTEAERRLQRLQPTTPPAPLLARTEPDLDALAGAGRADLLAGEAQLAAYRADAVWRDGIAALVGWTPRADLPRLADRLGEVGAAAVPLPAPRGVEPPTAPAPGAARRAFAPLVGAYTTVPYADVDPTVLAGLAYVVMFGAMFGDVGHGALLVLGAALIRFGRLRAGPLRRLAALRPHWLLVAGAGLSSALFGAAYGECFGPTGLVPTLWLAPMAQPVPLLAAGVAMGAVLLAGAYVLGTVNRVREGGWAVALYAPSGVAGALLLLAGGLAALAWYTHATWAGVAAAVLAVVAVALAFTGLLAGSGGGAAGFLQAGVELFDVLIRVGTNVVSFARLAAFGLTHAVLGWIVWTATTGLWHRGPAFAVVAVVVFAVGNAVAFALEALVAGVQALRLEYYELFSRVFQVQGRPFRPWHVPMADPISDSPEEAPCSSG
jgi:V/A-type H+-transporting ATPase subunit I